MIHYFFSSEDALAILGIPLSFGLPRDQLLWAYNPKGVFRVRSAYKVALTLGRAPVLGKLPSIKIIRFSGEQSGG